MRSRRAALIVLASGLAIVLAGAPLPAQLHRSTQTATALDTVLPAYQFSEFHSTRVHATPERAFAAVKAVTSREIRLLRTLMAIRSLVQAELPEGRPMLATMNELGYQTLVERPDREIVLGGAFPGSGRPPACLPDAPALKPPPPRPPRTALRGAAPAVRVSTGQYDRTPAVASSPHLPYSTDRSRDDRASKRAGRPADRDRLMRCAGRN